MNIVIFYKEILELINRQYVSVPDADGIVLRHDA